MFTRQRSALGLMLAVLAFGCEQGNSNEANELVDAYAHVASTLGQMDGRERNLLVLAASMSLVAPVKRAVEGPEAPVVEVPGSGPIQIVGQLLRDVPEAGAKTGDRVVFRPDQPDWRRRCVVMHTTDAEHFLPALADGTIEIIANQNGGDDPRRCLEDRIPRPPVPLSLAS